MGLRGEEGGGFDVVDGHTEIAGDLDFNDDADGSVPTSEHQHMKLITGGDHAAIVIVRPTASCLFVWPMF